jgi:hypothetical protein
VTDHEEPQDESEEPLARSLSHDDVFEAADRVLMAGGRVTIDRVRNHLGRGSPNTIQEHLET